MPTHKPPHRRPLALQPRDFTYVYEVGVGQTYRNGPYLILVGRNSYCATYRGQTFSWGLEDFLSAIEACARPDAARRNHGSSHYTQRYDRGTWAAHLGVGVRKGQLNKCLL